MNARLGAYKLFVFLQDGRQELIEQGHNPTTVRDAHNRVSRNAKVIRRIELHDHEGCVDAIWDASWQ